MHLESLPHSDTDYSAARAIEFMIVDTLIAAEPHMKIAKRIFDRERYLFLTDDILTQIEASTAPVCLYSLIMYSCFRLIDFHRN